MAWREMRNGERTWAVLAPVVTFLLGAGAVHSGMLFAEKADATPNIGGTPTTIAIGAAAIGGGQITFAGLSCSPENRDVIIAEAPNTPEGTHSMYRAINVTFGEEQVDIGVPPNLNNEFVQHIVAATNAAKGTNIVVTNPDDVPPGTYVVPAHCNGGDTRW